MRIFGLAVLPRDLRFRTTRQMARLGTIAAVLAGIALAFRVGGVEGYTVPLSYLLGAPANGIVFRLLSFFIHLPSDTIASGGPASEWSIYHLIFCASIALNWTALGFLADIFGGGPPNDLARVRDNPVSPERLLEGNDPLAMEFDELERRIRETRRQRDPEARRHAA